MNGIEMALTGIMKDYPDVLESITRSTIESLSDLKGMAKSMKKKLKRATSRANIMSGDNRKRLVHSVQIPVK